MSLLQPCDYGAVVPDYQPCMNMSNDTDGGISHPGGGSLCMELNVHVVLMSKQRTIWYACEVRCHARMASASDGPSNKPLQGGIMPCSFCISPGLSKQQPISMPSAFCTKLHNRIYLDNKCRHEQSTTVSYPLHVIITVLFQVETQPQCKSWRNQESSWFPTFGGGCDGKRPPCSAGVSAPV